MRVAINEQCQTKNISQLPNVDFTRFVPFIILTYLEMNSKKTCVAPDNLIKDMFLTFHNITILNL